MRRFFISLISLYKLCISPFMGSHCRFYPSCSTYAQEAIEAHGIAKGSYLSFRRVCRCHPWHEGGVDPVPPCSNSH